MIKYNWQVIGQEKISQFLQKNIDKQKLAHGYLFIGKEHLGKSLMAQKFIASLLCKDYHEQNQSPVEILPCANCVFCSQLAKNIHPDVYFLKREEDKKNITVEQVREMQKVLYLTSFLNSYKIALIEKADELSESAQNALLKILEEPRPKTIIILIASDLKFLLPTIVSRCRVIKFYPVNTENIFQHMINLGATREEARDYSALAHGQIGLAVNLYNNPDYYKAYLEKTKQFIELFDSNLAERFEFVAQLMAGHDSSIQKTQFLTTELEFWQLFIRDILFLKYNLGHLLVNLNYKEKLEKLAKKYNSAKLVGLLLIINKIQKTLNYNINSQLALENLVLNF